MYLVATAKLPHPTPHTALKLYSSLFIPRWGTFVFFVVLLLEIYAINNSLWSVEDLLRHVHVKLFSHHSSESKVFPQRSLRLVASCWELWSGCWTALWERKKGSRGWGHSLESWLYRHLAINMYIHKPLCVVLLQENNQQQGGVVKQHFCYRPKGWLISYQALPWVFYFSYPTAICNHHNAF